LFQRRPPPLRIVLRDRFAQLFLPAARLGGGQHGLQPCPVRLLHLQVRILGQGDPLIQGGQHRGADGRRTRPQPRRCRAGFALPRRHPIGTQRRAEQRHRPLPGEAALARVPAGLGQARRIQARQELPVLFVRVQFRLQLVQPCRQVGVGRFVLHQRLGPLRLLARLRRQG
jgi:hypothetical protein